MTLDLKALYRVAGYAGIAFYLTGYATEWVQPEPELVCEVATCDHQELSCWFEPETVLVTDENFVIGVMVGDDYEHHIDVDDLTVLEEDDGDICSCGQIGCAWG